MPLLERRQPGLLQPLRLARERLVVGEVAERRPVPQLERLAQPAGRALGLAARERRATLAHERVEPPRVELAVGDLQRVAAVARREPAVAERLAQPGDEVVQAAPRRRRRRLAPEPVDQPIARQRLVGVQQEDGEQDALPALLQRHGPCAVLDLERAKDAKSHAGLWRRVPAARDAVA